MNLISREELQAKRDNGDNFKLVMALGQFAYDEKHIPGSIQCDSLEIANEMLHPDDEIVLYCAGPTCFASVSAYQMLEKAGYKNLHRYAGGIEDWETAGLPLESSK